jgi:hypothetical protein
MAAQRQYATAGAFRTALEARLNERARRDGVDRHRLRRQVTFDRLLARMFDPSQPARDGWVLKGGYARRWPKAIVTCSSSIYRSKVESLASALQREDTRLEASEMLRGLIDSIVLIPDEGQLRIELRGNLAAMLTAAQQTKRSPETGDLLVPVQLVAGARNKLYRQLCWAAA